MITTTETITSVIDEIESIGDLLPAPSDHWCEEAASHLRNYRELTDTDVRRMIADAYERGYVAGQGLKG